MTGQGPERELVIAYAPPGAREGLRALLALDDALAGLVRTTTEPALGQMRLAWWNDALIGLDRAPAPAEPVLRALAAEVLPAGVRAGELTRLVEGWAVLIEEERLDGEALQRFAEERGSALFAVAGRLLGARESDPLREAGQGWALGDLARHLGDRQEAERARVMASPLLAKAAMHVWSRPARPLGALAHLARIDLALPPGAPAPIGKPSRVARLFWHRLTGR